MFTASWRGKVRTEDEKVQKIWPHNNVFFANPSWKDVKAKFCRLADETEGGGMLRLGLCPGSPEKNSNILTKIYCSK